MHRSVPFSKIGLRAAALAAVLGGQTACVQSVPLVAPTNATEISSVAASVRTPGKASSENAPKIVVRDYWGSPRANVVAWADDEAWQGLRAAVLRDGTVAYDHSLFFGAYSVPNLDTFRGAEWYAFADTAVGGRQLLVQGMEVDQFNCQGKKGCSPYVTFRARLPDAFLRGTHDSLVVKVVSHDGFETMISLRGDLIGSYLATVDSVSAARKAQSRTSHN